MDTGAFLEWCRRKRISVWHVSHPESTQFIPSAEREDTDRKACDQTSHPLCVSWMLTTELVMAIIFEERNYNVIKNLWHTTKCSYCTLLCVLFFGIFNSNLLWNPNCPSSIFWCVAAVKEKRIKNGTKGSHGDKSWSQIKPEHSRIFQTDLE